MAAPAPLSPLAPKKYPTLPEIEGVRFATAAAGVRYSGRTDVMLALFDAPAEVAGVFTRSKCPSAPVDWCRAQLAAGQGARAGRQFRQRQRLHRRHRRERGRRMSARPSRKTTGAQAQRSLHGLDRRDRRAARCQPDRRARSTPWSRAPSPTR